ncbi:MAG TPA: hypothetical protein VGU02_02350 [Gaiellaceae bacterium]|nr:hypothetical protein [Gaiellaceae bacterium]
MTTFLMVYSISTSGIKHRAHPRYTSTALLMVNSASNPYLRTSVSAVIQRTVKTQAARRAAAATQSPATSVSQQAPNTHALVEAANLFPLLIESDQTKARRTRMFGNLQGVITANALYSFVTPSRFKQSSFPVIAVNATARGPKLAEKLAQDTTLAFKSWLTSSEDASKVPVGQRIFVEELQSPSKSVASAGTKKSLPVALGIAVLLLFCGAAVLLDRLRPGQPEVPGAVDRSTAVAA